MTETDHQKWLEGETGEAAQEAYKYFMRPDPDQREFLGPIETEDDPLTGMVAKYRMAKIGMVRNAPADSMREVKVYLGFNDTTYIPHIRIDKAKPLQGWYQDKHNYKPGSRARPCFSEALLTEPYGGYCTVGCAFCYVNSGFRGYRGTGLVSVPVRYGEQVRKMLSKTTSSTAGYFSSFTDPFLPIEDVYHNTKEGAEAFVELGLPIFFLSRLHYPAWAIDLLRRNRFSYAQKSLNTGNHDDYNKFSPGAITLAEHLDEVRELRRKGIYTSIQVNPIVPGITTHEDIRSLFEQLAAVGNNHVIVKFVEAGYSWSPAMIERLAKRFGAARAAKFTELFSENQAGAQKTITQPYRIEGHQLYKQWATELGMTYSTCYEYRRGIPGNGEPGWVSVGREYTTADQCHGQRVPMYTRKSIHDRFVEVAECAPTGCLYCADDNGGQARCGSDEWGAARALRAADYKRVIPIKPF
jgi:DNA repair photolyase